MLAEHALDRRGLNAIVVRRRGAVRVDVVNLIGTDTGRRDRRVHHAEGAIAVLRWRGHVIRVTGHAIADHLGVNRRAAALGELEFLEHHHAGAFAQHEAVAVLLERTARARRIVVARRQGAQRGKTANPHRTHRRFSAARDHGVGRAALDNLERVTDRVRRRRACGAGRQVGALRAEANRHLPRRQINDGGRDEERRDLARPTCEVGLVLPFDGGKPADARSNEHADAIREVGRDRQSRILHRELRRRDRELNEDIHLLQLFLLDEL